MYLACAFFPASVLFAAACSCCASSALVSGSGPFVTLVSLVSWSSSCAFCPVGWAGCVGDGWADAGVPGSASWPIWSMELGRKSAWRAGSGWFAVLSQSSQLFQLVAPPRPCQPQGWLHHVLLPHPQLSQESWLSSNCVCARAVCTFLASGCFSLGEACCVAACAASAKAFSSWRGVASKVSCVSDPVCVEGPARRQVAHDALL